MQTNIQSIQIFLNKCLKNKLVKNYPKRETVGKMEEMIRLRKLPPDFQQIVFPTWLDPRQFSCDPSSFGSDRFRRKALI